MLADKGYISLDVEYIDGTKIESKANKYTFVWRKSTEKNRAKLMEKIKVLLEQVDDSIAQENGNEDDPLCFTPSACVTWPSVSTIPWRPTPSLLQRKAQKTARKSGSKIAFNIKKMWFIRHFE